MSVPQPVAHSPPCASRFAARSDGVQTRLVSRSAFDTLPGPEGGFGSFRPSLPPLRQRHHRARALVTSSSSATRSAIWLAASSWPKKSTEIRKSECSFVRRTLMPPIVAALVENSGQSKSGVGWQPSGGNAACSRSIGARSSSERSPGNRLGPPIQMTRSIAASIAEQIAEPRPRSRFECAYRIPQSPPGHRLSSAGTDPSSGERQSPRCRTTAVFGWSVLVAMNTNIEKRNSLAMTAILWARPAPARRRSAT